jgi:hypothetical protein
LCSRNAHETERDDDRRQRKPESNQPVMQMQARFCLYEFRVEGIEGLQIRFSFAVLYE